MVTALRNAVDKTVEAVEHGRTSARNAAADLRDHDYKSDVSSYKDEVMHAVQSALSTVKSQSGRLMHKAGDAYDTARHQTADAAMQTRDFVKTHPVAVIAAAAGVGALVALLMLRRR